LSPDIWFVIAGFLPDARRSLTGTHGFKYGKLRRAELKYPGNVKPRSMNKIFRKMFVQNSRDGVVTASGATNFGRSLVGY
jgi:hypothetical protein